MTCQVPRLGNLSLDLTLEKAMDLRNDRVTPPVVVRYTRTTSSSKYSAVTYISPTTGKLLDASKLTPLQKGHVYLWKNNTNSRKHIRMPNLCMNSATATLLRGLASFQVEGDRVFSHQRFSTKTVNCLHDFSLSSTDFAVFSARVTAFGGIVEKDVVKTKELENDINSIRDGVPVLLEEVRVYRSVWCRDPGTQEIADEQTLTKVLASLRVFKNRMDEFDATRITIAKQLDKLSKDAELRERYVVLQTAFDRLKDVLEALDTLNFDRYEREAAHKLRTSASHDSGIKPEYLGALAEELGSLKRTFPALQRLYATQDEVIVDLPCSVRITLRSDGGVKIDGDLAGLKPYIEEVTGLKAPEERRRRAIFSEDEGEIQGDLAKS